MILMIDYYDSFTYNIIHYLEGMNEEVMVKTPDELTITSIESLQPEIIILSPGPGHPKDAELALNVVHQFKGKIPILGICLGFQVIVTAFGGIVEGRPPVHGHSYEISHDQKGIFLELPNPLKVGRYHSLQAVEVPDVLEISAKSENIIMAVRHLDYLIEAVQYHPESILTEYGREQLANFIQEVRR